MNTITLTFTQQQMQVLNSALMELPFKISAPVIQHINAEIQKQFDKAVDAKDDKVVTTN